MKQKTGHKEAVNLAVFITVPQLICDYIGYGMAKINSGYWLNFTICSLVVFLLVLPLKKSFTQNLNVYTHTSIIEKIISVIFVINIFTLSLYNLQISSKALLPLVKSSFGTDIIVFLPLAAALVCSCLGIEAISRTAYFTMFICIGIIFLICAVSFDGLDSQNVYPLFGNDYSGTFLDFSSIGIYAPLVTIYMLRSSISEPQKSFSVLKKSIAGVYIIGMVLIVLCILAIPYPMINYYEFSLSAIFSIAKSSVFFHRFELLLIFLMMIISTMSLSVGISLFAKKVSDLTNSHDFRPFSLVFGVTLFYLCMVIEYIGMVLTIYHVTCISLYVLLLIKSVIVLLKPKAKRGIN